MTNLSKYLANTKTPQAKFAAEIKRSKGHVSLLASGRRLPDLTLATLIEKITGGLVPANGWVSPNQDVDASGQTQGQESHTSGIIEQTAP